MDKLDLERIVAVMLILFSIAFFGNIATGAFSSASHSSPQNSVISYVKPSPVYRTITVTIVDDTLVVEPGYYRYYQFSIPEEAGVVTVNGRFTTTGGEGNDIMVFIMTPDDFINWQNRHESRVYYQSGQKTVDSINVNLAPGTYYLVYSNTFSLVSNKVVKTNLSYSYQKCVQYCD